jgi:hypothetical protein
MKLIQIFYASAAIFVLSGNGASAQSIQQYWERCQNGTPGNEVIANCTALINSGQGDARTRSAEYTLRGLAYEYIDQPAKAHADYCTALKLNSGNASALLGLQGLPCP